MNLQIEIFLEFRFQYIKEEPNLKVILFVVLVKKNSSEDSENLLIKSVVGIYGSLSKTGESFFPIVFLASIITLYKFLTILWKFFFPSLFSIRNVIEARIRQKDG